MTKKKNSIDMWIIILFSFRKGYLLAMTVGSRNMMHSKTYRKNRIDFVNLYSLLVS